MASATIGEAGGEGRAASQGWGYLLRRSGPLDPVGLVVLLRLLSFTVDTGAWDMIVAETIGCHRFRGRGCQQTI